MQTTTNLDKLLAEDGVHGFFKQDGIPHFGLLHIERLWRLRKDVLSDDVNGGIFAAPAASTASAPPLRYED